MMWLFSIYLSCYPNGVLFYLFMEGVATLTFNSRKRQGLARVRAKREAWESYFTLPSELPLWELEPQWTPKSSKNNCKGQNPLD
jgi:hypothetical protein